MRVIAHAIKWQRRRIFMCKSLLTFALVGVLGVSVVHDAKPQEASNTSMVEIGYETCGAIKGMMAVLLAEARTDCQPANDNRKIAIVLASPLPLFKEYVTKRAWFIAAIGSVGYEVRRFGLSHFTTLYMMDSDSTASLTSYSIPISRAAQLQGRTKAGSMTADGLVNAVMQEMVPTKIPARLMGK